VETLGLRGAKRIRELLASQADSRGSRELARLKSDVRSATLDDFRTGAGSLTLRTLFTELGFQSKIPPNSAARAVEERTTGWIETREPISRPDAAGRSRIAIELVEGEGSAWTAWRSLRGGGVHHLSADPPSDLPVAWLGASQSGF
jgi:hypothetical protein